MKIYYRLTILLACLGIMIFCFACKTQPQGKVVVTKKEFFVTQDSKYMWGLHAKGTIKNTGLVDVKKVLITGYCRSCNEIVVSGGWTVNDIEKTPEQKDTINYIPAGAEAEFEFKEIAYFFGPTSQGPEKIPEQLEVVIESFETIID